MDKKVKIARREATKRLRDTTAKLPTSALPRLLGYAEGIAAGVELAKQGDNQRQ
ncbi:MAG: hypothetical protein IKY59_06750 [Oscillospiraceae bacterium]|nr:hypothetical protein [Oscillospiraceae bacterium]